jgi:hypothetical protein
LTLAAATQVGKVYATELDDKLLANSFQSAKTADDWPNHSYCTMFRKPSL